MQPHRPGTMEQELGGQRKRGRTLTYWLGVWNRRQEQRNWQHVGSRWYKSSSRMRIATMNTDVDTAAKRRERRESRWFDRGCRLEKPLRSRFDLLPVPRALKPLCAQRLSLPTTPGTTCRAGRASPHPGPRRQGPTRGDLHWHRHRASLARGSRLSQHHGKAPVRQCAGLPGTRSSPRPTRGSAEPAGTASPRQTPPATPAPPAPPDAANTASPRPRSAPAPLPQASGTPRIRSGRCSERSPARPQVSPYRHSPGGAGRGRSRPAAAPAPLPAPPEPPPATHWRR